MPSDLIYREDAKDFVRHAYHKGLNPVEYLDEIPAADVVEARRAAWQSWEQDKPPFKWYSCDYCGFHALSRSNYCPNCGADMRGEENDAAD